MKLKLHLYLRPALRDSVLDVGLKRGYNIKRRDKSLLYFHFYYIKIQCMKVSKKKVKKELNSVKNLKDLEGISKKYLGRQSELTLILRSLAKMPKAKRIKDGKEANNLKDYIKEILKEKAKQINPFSVSPENNDWFDITAPGKKPILGHLHPLTLARREVQNIFESMGFSVIEGPEMENEWYGFDALNIPKNHPARDAWDTFWLRQNEIKNQKSKIKNERLLLRPHTSPVQIRYLEKNNPPLRIIAPGTVFRHEATDASHEFQLFQVEGLMVGKDISASNFKAIINEFFSRFFKKPVKSRLRPDFFPFTEPSFDVSITCVICDGKGCPVCKQTGWVEVAGAGMVHPNVLKNSGLIPHQYSGSGWQGWACGFGLERLAMMKYKINDIRLFRSGDLRFLNQF